MATSAWREPAAPATSGQPGSPTNPQDYGIDIAIGSGSGAIQLLLPNTINVNSPAFKQAAKPCHLA